MDVVELMSGGFDSTGQALILKERGHTIYPLYVQFRKGGGKVAKELRAVAEISKACGFEEPKIIVHYISKHDYGTRNRTLCRIAAGYAQEIGARIVATGAVLSPEDIGGATNFPPDDATLEHLQAAVPDGITVWILEMHKSMVVRALPPKLRSMLFKTTSCQMWYKKECGCCYVCVERHAAFILTMGYDHTRYIRDPKLSEEWKQNIFWEQRALDANTEYQHETT